MFDPPDLNSYSSFDSSEISLATTGPTKYASCFTTMMNLLNTLVGAEILGIANSFTLTGLVLSVVLMIITAMLSYCASIIVVRLQNRTKSESINEIATKLFGKWGGVTLSILTLCFTYSAQVAYLVIASEAIETWLTLAHAESWTHGWKRSLVILGYSLILPVALTIPKKMTFLNTASTTAIFFLVVFVFVMIYEAIHMLPHSSTSMFNPTCETAIFSLKIFNALAIYSMIFALPAIVLPLLLPYDPSLNKRYFLMGGAFMTCFTIILIPSVCGYLIFGATTAQTIFASFPDSDIVIQIMRVLFFFVVNASFPVVGIAVATDISALMYNVHDPAKLDWKRRAICLLIADGPPVLLAMVLPGVRLALEIGGSFGGCLTNFFFPAIMWIKQSPHKMTHWTNILLFGFAAFGLISAGIATYQAVIDLIDHIKHPEQHK